MLLLDTKGKMNIVETENYNVVDFKIADEILEKKFYEVKEYFKTLVETIIYEENVVLRLHFTEPTTEEELIDLSDVIAEYFVDVMAGEKHEAEIWQPRSTLIDRINLKLYSQIKIINHDMKFKNFNIKILHNEKEIYEMIE